MPEDLITISVRVSQATIDELDSKRGDRSRAMFTRRALERALAGTGSSDGPSGPLPGAGRAARSNPK